MFASILKDNHEEIKGFEINYRTGQKTPFSFAIDPSQDLKGVDRQTKTIGIISPARFLIYNVLPAKANLMDGSGFPMEHSGILPDDRILSVDGQLIFSSRQLSEVINQPKVLLTVSREDKVFVTRVPRFKNFRSSSNSEEKAELDDSHHAANLKDKVNQLFFIPYNLTHDCVVENAYSYIDENSEEHIFDKTVRSPMEMPLKNGDRIVAVDGAHVSDSIDFLSKLQSRRVHIVVERGMNLSPVSWQEADDKFDSNVNWGHLNQLVQSIG